MASPTPADLLRALAEDPARDLRVTDRRETHPGAVPMVVGRWS